MDAYAACETAYRNGYTKGYHEAIQKAIEVIHANFNHDEILLNDNLLSILHILNTQLKGEIK